MRPRLITAENVPVSARAAGRLIRFNEAAAHHRGERLHAGVDDRRVAASMRPRLITAENCSDIAIPTEWRSASMRPRLITAENEIVCPQNSQTTSLQ